MAVASSIPCLKIPTSSSCCTSASSSNSSYSSSSYRISSRTKLPSFTVTCSQAEGPIRRPVAPPLREPSPVKPMPPSPPQPSPPSSVEQPPKPAVAAEDKNVVTLEFQRQKAKELQEYFKQKKLEEANVGPFFGFIGKNEIANGRWAMFGFAVGMLTEYATGSDFVDQQTVKSGNSSTVAALL